MYICIRIFVDVLLYIYIYIHICMYVYIYIYMYICIHIHIYIYIERERERSGRRRRGERRGRRLRLEAVRALLRGRHGRRPDEVAALGISQKKKGLCVPGCHSGSIVVHMGLMNIEIPLNSWRENNKMMRSRGLSRADPRDSRDPRGPPPLRRSPAAPRRPPPPTTCRSCSPNAFEFSRTRLGQMFTTAPPGSPEEPPARSNRQD